MQLGLVRFIRVVYTLQNKGSHNNLTHRHILDFVVYTLQNKGSHNTEAEEFTDFAVVYTLQNKGSHNLLFTNS